MADYTVDDLNIAAPVVSQETAGDILSRMLQNRSATDALAVAANRGNKLATEGAGNDLLNLTYGELALKYGEETARNRNKIQGSLQDYYEKTNATRTPSEIIADSALDASAGLTGVVGGLTSLGTAGVSKAAGALGFENSSLNYAANAIANGTNSISEGIKGYQSDQLKDRQKISNTEKELDDRDLDAEFKDDNSLIGKFQKVGKAALNTGDRLLNDPAVAGSIIAEAAGSLIPSVKLANAGASLLAGAALRAGGSPLTQRAVSALGAATGVGVSEASGTYADTLKAVSDMSHEALMLGSEEYRKSIASGSSREESKSNLAVNVGIQAFAQQLPVATALGLFVSKFERAPIGSFSGAGVVGGTRQIGLQTIEEGLQGGSSQLNQNIALQGNVDSKLDITKGIGDQIATGAIAGAGLSGALAVPGSIAAGTKSSVKAVSEAIDNTANKELVKTGLSKASEILAKAGTAVTTGTEAAEKAGKEFRDRIKPAVEPIVEKVKPYVNQAKAAASEVATVVGDKVEDLATKPNELIRNETVKAAKEVEILLAEDPNYDKASEAPEAGVSKAFKGIVDPKQTIPEKVVGILNRLSETSVRINKLDPADVLYASKKFSELQDIAANATKTTKDKISQILSSSIVDDIKKAVSNIDLNKVHNESTKVTPETIIESVEVAKVNPANVNPGFIRKLLKQDNRKDISNEDIKLLETAASVAEAVNNHIGNKVEISKELNVTLSQKPNYKADPKSLPEVLTAEGVSRSIQMDGFRDAVGKDLRSVNDFAADFIKGVQSPNGKFRNDRGFEVDSSNVAKQFSMFANHMINKVEALNTSYDSNNKQGKGLKVAFDTLVGGKKFIPKDGSKGVPSNVFYDRSSPKSIKIASDIHNDAVVAARVYGILQEAFPKSFPKEKLVVPALKKDNANLANTNETTSETVTEPKVEALPKPIDKSLDASVEMTDEVVAQVGNRNDDDIVEKSEAFLRNLDPKKFPPLEEDTYGDTSEMDVYRALDVKNKFFETGKAQFKSVTTAYAKMQKDGIPFSYYNMIKVGEILGSSDKNAIDSLIGLVGSTREPLDPKTELTEEFVSKIGEATDNDLGEKSRKLLLDTDLSEADTYDFTVFDAFNEKTQFLKNGKSNYAPEIAEAYSVMKENDIPFSYYNMMRVLERYRSGDKTSVQKLFDVVEPEVGDVKPTYAQRSVLNAKSILNWAKAQGFPSTLEAADLHVTTFYSKDPVDRSKPGIQARTGNMQIRGGKRTVERFGDEAIVLTIESKALQDRYAEAKVDGVTSDFPTYRPHITISYSPDFDISKVEPYTGPIVLGPETIEDIKTDEELAAVKETAETKLGDVEPASPDTDYPDLPQRFNDTFTSLDNEDLVFESAESLLQFIETQEGYSEEYVDLARSLIPVIMTNVDKKLDQVKFSKDDPRTLREMIIAGEDITSFGQYKGLLTVEPKTGKHNKRLLGLASLAVIDWMTSTYSSDPSRVGEVIEELGITNKKLTTEQIGILGKGVYVGFAAEEIAPQVLKLWDMKLNQDAPMIDVNGAVQGLVKDILASANLINDLITIVPVPLSDDPNSKSTINMIDFSGMKRRRVVLGVKGQGVIRALYDPEEHTSPSINEKIKHVNQNYNRSEVPTSQNEKKAMKLMQDTEYRVVPEMANVVKHLGLKNMSKMFGYKSTEGIEGNFKLLLSREGKNLSVAKDFDDTIAIVDAVENNPENTVHYPVGITAVGRYQMKGINPQSNKFLRATVTPTASVLDMTTQADQDAFWLTVAQSSGLFKVENKKHETVLREIQGKFTNRYGEAVSLMEGFLKTGEMDNDAFTEQMGDEVEMAQISAVLAVAQLNIADENGTSNEFKTSLSFELDGKTNGSANMLVFFGQGVLRRDDIDNLKRVGYTLNAKDRTLNDFMESGGIDLYELAADSTLEKIYDRKTTDEVKAVNRFSVAFGDMSIEEQAGQAALKLKRSLAKGPMTQSVYAAGLSKVSDKIADDMLLEFYNKMVEVPEGINPSVYFNYPNFAQDYSLLFGTNFDPQIDWKMSFLDQKSVDQYMNLIQENLGSLIYDSIKDIMGPKIKGVNSTLIKATNMQADFTAKIFNRLLEERLEELAVEGKVGRNKAGKPIGSQISTREYNNLLKKVEIFTPVYDNGDQRLSIAEIVKLGSDKVMSSTMDGELRHKAMLRTPGPVRAKVIPNTIIGRGDAMTITRIYSGNNAPTNTIPIHDGIDMAVNKVKDYASVINNAVATNWEQDVLGDIVNDFESFLRYAKAMDPSGEFLKGSDSILAQLREARNQNLARNNAIKGIPRSIDQMSGSGTAVTRGEDLPELATISELNKMIVEEYKKLTKAPDVLPEAESYSGIQVTTADAMIKALLSESNDSLINKSVKAIIRKIPKKMLVVTGSIDELNAYRQKYYEDDGQVISGSGSLDTTNNVIFLAKKGNETLVHEFIHAATFELVLDHYNGNTNDAVSRLEELMKEFMGLDFSTSNDQTQTAVNAAKAAILEHQANNEPFSKAAALNEFMAWSLSNEQIAKTLKTTRTSVVSRLTKKVIHLIKKMMGGVPNDMFSNILFNTELLTRTSNEIPDPSMNSGSNNPDIFDEGNGNGRGNDGGDNGDSSGGDLTPRAERFTNYWIDLVRQRLDEYTARIDKLKTKPSRERTTEDQAAIDKKNQLLRYDRVADNVIQRLNFGGFSLGPKQRVTFKAMHMILATEMKLDTTSAEALNKVFGHVTSNLKPEMFEEEGQFSTVFEMFGGTKNDEGVSDSIATLLALSQTSKVFRAALDQLPLVDPESLDTSSVNGILGTAATMMMQKAVGSIDVAGTDINSVLDNLAESIMYSDSEKDFQGLNTLMDSLSVADKYLSGVLSQIAYKTAEVNDGLNNLNSTKLTQSFVGTLSLAANLLDKDRSKFTAKALNDAILSTDASSKAIFVREFVSEVIGTDEINAATVALHDRATKSVTAARQDFRENVPVILQNFFKTHPNETEWKSFHRVLGKADFATLFDLNKPNESMRLIKQSRFLDRRIRDAEKIIKSNFSRSEATTILEKSDQLGKFMSQGEIGHQLWTNAYAINKLGSKKFNEAMTTEIDRLVSLYAIKYADQGQKDDVSRIFDNDPEGVKALLVYLQTLNQKEDAKTVSERAKLNAYKGYIPDEGGKDNSLIIEPDSNRERLLEMGYVRVADAPASIDIATQTHGYYFTTTKQTGMYTQGVMQSVRSSYRGVDANNGISNNGFTSGSISGDSADSVTDHMNTIASLPDDKEALLPRYNEDGTVSFYERMINPDLIEKYMKPRSNLALMLGSWEGRQTEEKFAQQYNFELVDQLKKIYDERGIGDNRLFINLAQEAKTAKDYKEASREQRQFIRKGDQIYADAWNMIPPETKEYIEEVFGKDRFMVRKNMINLSVGYREASVIDSWTGKSRLPDGVQETVKAVAKTFIGKDAVAILSGGEKGLQSLVSAAKQLIAIRSLVVPMMNLTANVLQMTTNGVGTKDIIRGYSDKFKEIEIYNNNEVRILELETKVRLAGNRKSRVAVLEDQIQAIKDENARMSIAPVIEAGAYKNISEGITDLDVQLTSGRIAEYLDKQVNKLPGPLRTAAKYGFVSKDTALYKGANKLVQYGDFLAKSIYYDHMIQRMKLGPEEAIKRMNEEFVNYSLPAGRVRSAAESSGLTWFLTFKIRILKIAMRQMRDNPLRALISAGTIGGLGSPIEDNLVSVVADDKLGYSLGLGMLTTAPELNPWVNVVK